MEKINNLLADKLIGFDAGDAIRSATVLSPGFSTLKNLKQSNTFRIDGKILHLFHPSLSASPPNLQVTASPQPILDTSVAWTPMLLVVIQITYRPFLAGVIQMKAQKVIFQTW